MQDMPFQRHKIQYFYQGACPGRRGIVTHFQIIKSPPQKKNPGGATDSILSYAY